MLMFEAKVAMCFVYLDGGNEGAASDNELVRWNLYLAVLILL